MYSYKIIKNEGVGLKGYGYTMKIYRGSELISREGAFGGKEQALEWLDRFMRLQIEQYGIIEVAGIKKL